MSVGHGEASFNHSRLKFPGDSSSTVGKPSPKEGERISSAVGNCCRRKKEEFSRWNDFKSVKSYLEFYESIPDYSELRHLSSEEFYSRLKALKITQERLRGDSSNDGGNSNLDDQFSRKPKGREHSFFPSACCSDLIGENDNEDESRKESSLKINFESDSSGKNSDGEADGESSNFRPGEKLEDDGRNRFSGGCSERIRSLSISPRCDCHHCPEFRLGHPESNFMNELHPPCSLKEKSLVRKPQRIRPRPVPLTSRIPLYDKIMLEKEARRRIIHERYSEKLRSLVQPFSFTKREDENRRLLMVRSNPELTSFDSPTAVKFESKPIPKNLFGNRACERMKEEEYYRALKRRVRAEELLKSSWLPPSMALREKKHLSKSLDSMRNCRKLRNGRDPEGNKSKRINSGTDSSTLTSPCESVPAGSKRSNVRPCSAVGCSRSNLASALRIKAARKRLEKEIREKLEENRIREEAKLKARIIRMNPEWKALNRGKGEDLALRVATRREEDKLRRERHQRSMEAMYGRVYRIPPLFDRERFLEGGNSKTKSTIGRKDSDDKSNKTNSKTSEGLMGEEEEENNWSSQFQLPEVEKEKSFGSFEGGTGVKRGKE